MSRTLADVEAYRVYRDGDGSHKWHDGVLVCIRADNGNIYTSDKSRADHIITSPCLGHVRDEPWRKADVGQPGSLADAHNRIDAMQARVDTAIKNHTREMVSVLNRLAALEQRPVEPVNQCNAPPPARPTQPPDVAVYELKYVDGRVRRYEYPSSDVNFHRPRDGACETRTVLDAFDRLTWDDLRRWGLNVLGPAYDIDTWDILRIGGQTVSKHPTEREALTAARAIARKEGWR